MENQGDDDLPIHEYASHKSIGDLSCIRWPPIQAQCFEIKNTTMIMLNRIQFNDLPSKDPNLHISQFFKIFNMFKYHGISNDDFKLRHFSWT